MPARRPGPSVRPGIGGWLLVFFVTLAVAPPFQALVGILRTYRDGGPLVSWFEAVGFVSDAVTIALCWAAVLRLMRVRNWGSVQLAIGALWLVPLVRFVSEWLRLSWLLGWIPVPVPASADILFTLAYSAVWTAYLLRSARVARTYRRLRPTNGQRRSKRPSVSACPDAIAPRCACAYTAPIPGGALMRA